MTAGHENMGRGMMRGSNTPWAQGPAGFWAICDHIVSSTFISTKKPGMMSK